MNTPFKKLVFRTFLIWLPIVLVVMASAFALARIEHQSSLRLIADREFGHTDALSTIIADDLQDSIGDLNFLNESGTFHEYLDGSISPDLLASDWIRAARAKSYFDQIRFIDTSGKEIVRINQGPSGPYRVAAKDLANQVHRAYVYEALRLAKGKIYISPLDLEVEQGKITEPRKPTIRFSTPAYDKNGKIRGVVVLNYAADKFLSHLIDGPEGSGLWLIDDKGYWLRGPDPAEEWGFQLGHGRRITDRFPQVAQKLISERGGIIKSDTGLFAFHDVVPFRNLTDILGSPAWNYTWKLISYLDQQTIDRLLVESLNRAMATGALLSLLLLLPAFFLARQVQMRQSTQALLAQSERHYRLLAENVADLIWTLDPATDKLDYVSPSVRNMLGYDAEEIQGKTMDALFSAATRESKISELHAWFVRGDFSRHRSQTIEIEFQRKDGSTVWTEVKITIVEDEGKRFFVLGVTRDITERKLLEEKLKALSETDMLTGLHNRRKMEESMLEQLSYAQRYHRPFSVILFDVDHFKRVNDNYGHEMGDTVLKRIASAVSAIVRGTDKLGRWGGEEFLIVAPETDAETAQELAERVRESVSDIDLPRVGTLTVSLGVVSYDGTFSQEILLRKVDEALYRAKREGRNRVEFAR